MAEDAYRRAWNRAHELEGRVDRVLQQFTVFVEHYPTERFDYETQNASTKIMDIIRELPTNHHAVAVMSYLLLHMKLDADEKGPDLGDVMIGAVTKLMAIGLLEMRKAQAMQAVETKGNA